VYYLELILWMEVQGLAGMITHFERHFLAHKEFSGTTGSLAS